MASSLLCSTCKLQYRHLASFAQDLRTQFSSFLAQLADGTRLPSSPPPLPVQQYRLPSSRHHPGCPLCDLFSAAFPQEAPHRNLFIFPFLMQFGRHLRESRECEDMCVGVHPNPLQRTDLAPRSLVVMSETRAEARFGRPKRIEKLVDWATLTCWIDVCGRLHGSMCKQEGDTPEIRGLKLIDCKSRSVVRATTGMRWVALSYVWSLASPRVSADAGTCQPGLGHAGMALPSSLLGIVSDAMEATLALGYRYLWTDQFCINQCDKDEVADQVGKMDRIYRGAELTLVAASARNGLPGSKALPRAEPKSVVVDHLDFFVAPMDPIGDIASSVWVTRGWCYQEEMLSRRLLYFTEAGVLFKCSRMTCYEAMRGLEIEANPQEMETKSRIHQIPNHLDTLPLGLEYPAGKANCKVLLDRCLEGKGSADRSVPTARFHIKAARQVISEFTRKRLSFDDDSLNAVSGVLNVFGAIDPPVRFCQGLPVSQDTPASFTDSLLLESLCWYHKDPSSVRRRDQFPSWSWAGWSGTVSWPRLPLQGSVSSGRLQSYLSDWNGFDAKHDARVLALAGGCGYLPTCNSTGDKTTHDCRSGASCNPFAAKFIRLEARAVPASLFGFRQSESKTTGRTWEDLVLHVGSNHPTDYEHYSYHAGAMLETEEEEVTFRASEQLSCEEFVDCVHRGELECIFLSEQFQSLAHVSVNLLVIERPSTGVAQRAGFIRFAFEMKPIEQTKVSYEQWKRLFVGSLFSRLTILPKTELWLS